MVWCALFGLLMAPAVWKYPCSVCEKPVTVNQRGVQCEACLLWSHSKCLGLSNCDYENLQMSEDGWCCATCWKLPFADCSHLSSSTSGSAEVALPDVSISRSNVSVSSVQSGSPLVSACSPLTRDLSIYFAKCHSLRHQISDLCHGQNPPSIVALCETWLDSTIRDCEIRLPDYQILRRDRDRHGGGVALYVHNSITTRRVTISDLYEWLQLK